MEALNGNPNIAARLTERALRHPERPAIVEGTGRRRRVTTFGQLAERVSRTAAGLRSRGFRAGDRALLFVPMSADLYASLLGVLHAGGVAVFLDAWSSRKRLEAAVAAADPAAFIGTPAAHLLRLWSARLRGVPLALLPARAPSRHRGAPADAPAALVTGDAPALVTFTTGSTGSPKAAMRSHDFLWAQHRVLAHHLGLVEGEVDMPTLPIFVLNNLAVGVTTVLPAMDPRRQGRLRPERILRQMEAEGVATTTGSPAIYERLAAYVERRGGLIPVRTLFTGGAPVFPRLAERLQATTAGQVHVLYGSTEAEPIATIPAAELVQAAIVAESDAPRAPAAPSASSASSSVRPGTRQRGLCAGRVVPEIDLRLLRPVDGPIALGSAGWAEWDAGHGPGEIAVAGDHVLRGYLGDPQAEALAKIRDGSRVWHRTGDGGHTDADGRLWLLGRLSQRVEKSNGTWWSTPAELRALGVAGIRHAAYFGVGPDRSQAVLCVEVDDRRAGIEDELRAALHPTPLDELFVLESMPRDPRHASKTDVPGLRAIIDR